MTFRRESLESSEDERRVLMTLQRYGGDRTRTEQDFNLVEVPSGIFASRKAFASSDEIDGYLAESLVEMWSRRLDNLFPEDRFSVRVVSAAETGGETGVLFYTVRSSPGRP
jgi:hypothetical protein